MDGACVMAETTAAFQQDAFDFGFDIYDIIPVVSKITVEPQYGKIQAGQTVDITIYIIDNSSTPGRSYPFTLITPPVIEIFDPLGVTFSAPAPMRQTGEGIYSYTKITTTTDVIGPYSAVFTAVNGTSLLRTKKHIIYTIL